MSKSRVIILCTGNSCRSQMAEGWWRHFGGDDWEVFSAGLTPHGLNPLAIRAMQEADIDITSHTSDALDRYLNDPFDLIVTVCGHADEVCPTFPNAPNRAHWPFDDPAKTTGSDEERMPEFRRVRDEIKSRVELFLNS